MNRELPPDEFLGSFIEAAREPEPVPPAMAKNIWAKLEPRMNAVDLPLEGVGLKTGWMAKSTLLAGALGVAAGAGAAFPAGWWMASNQAAPVAMSAELASPPPVPTPAPLPAELPKDPTPPSSPTPAKPVAPRPVAKVEAPPSFTERSALEQERYLIEQARTALLQQQLQAVDEALGEHSARFPQGQMVEDREALRIQRWMVAADPDKARTLLEAFRARFPKSRWGPALQRQLSGE